MSFFSCGAAEPLHCGRSALRLPLSPPKKVAGEVAEQQQRADMARVYKRLCRPCRYRLFAWRLPLRLRCELRTLLYAPTLRAQSGCAPPPAYIASGLARRPTERRSAAPCLSARGEPLRTSERRRALRRLCRLLPDAPRCGGYAPENNTAPLRSAAPNVMIV